MGDALNSLKKNLKKEFKTPEPEENQPGMFHSIFNMLTPSDDPHTAAAPSPAPQDDLDHTATDFFNRMKKR